MSRARIPVLAASVLLPLLVLTAFVLRPVPADPSGAALIVVADPIVADGVIDTIETEGDGTLDASTGTSAEGARALVEDGVVIATLVVNLEAPNDTLIIAGANGSRVNTAVVEAAEEIVDTLGRDLAVQDVHPADVPTHLPGWLVAGGLLLGLGLMLLRRWAGALLRRTRPPRHLAELIGTDALLYGVALGVAAVVAGLPGSPPAWIGLGALLVTISATVTAATLRSVGVWGLGLAASLFVLPVWLLARASHVLLLPEPLEAVGRWLPHGAAAEIADRMALFGDGATSRPWLVLLGWAVGGVLALALAYRLTRARADGADTTPAAIES